MKLPAGPVGVDRLTHAELESSRAGWWSDRFTELLRRKLAPLEGRSILDVGCGTGILAAQLLAAEPAPARVVGLDLDPARLRRVPGSVVGAGQSLPFPAATFSSTATVLTLQHVAEPLAVLGEMARVTRPGGVVLAVEADNLRQRLLLSTDDTALERAYAEFWQRAATANPEIHFGLGPRLPSLFLRAGFERCDLEGFLATHWRREEPKELFDRLRTRVETLAERYGIAATEEGRTLLAHLERARAGVPGGSDFHSISTVPLFLVTGRVPPAG